MSQFEPERYIELVDDLRSKYQSFPSTISIETLSLCNAYCSFCPYSKLKRKGSRLPDAIITKMINEVSSFPEDLELNIVLARVNETFLDKRWYDISMKFYYAKKNIKFGFFSNGSTINLDVISKLNSIPTVQYLNISLNYSSTEDFEANTKLDFNRIVNNIDLLHKQKKEGHFDPQVVISRVGSNDAKDAKFVAYVENRYPLFNVKVAQQVDWLCDFPEKNGQGDYKNLPCRQWFHVHILSDGREAFCCIDAEGQHCSGNIYKDTLLQMYNHPNKQKVRKTKSRQEIDLCRECLMLP